MIFDVRDMQKEDVPRCVEIINHIIAVGGSTAYEEPYSESDFEAHYFEEPPVSNVVLHNGTLVGFQAAFDVGDGFYSIGTFTDRTSSIRGAGRAVFKKTLADCNERGGEAILAKITSDNSGGLAFYSKMGFVDWKSIPNDHTRPNGTSVDRIVKRYNLG